MTSNVIAWLLERELIIPKGEWRRSPCTGQLEPFCRQPFYDAAIKNADDQRYLAHLSKLDQLRDGEENIRVKSFPAGATTAGWGSHEG